MHLINQITFKHHINKPVKDISRGIGILYKIVSVYYAIIYTFILYGIIVWGSAQGGGARYSLNGMYQHIAKLTHLLMEKIGLSTPIFG